MKRIKKEERMKTYDVLCALDLSIESDVSYSKIEKSIKKKIRDLFENYQTDFKIHDISIKVKAG